MSTLVDRLKTAVCQDGEIVVVMASDLVIRFPVADNPRLANGTLQQLSNIEVSPFGLHWPDLDEDLSFAGLLRGDFGQSRDCQTASGGRSIEVRG